MAWFIYNRSTTSTSYVDFFRSPRRPSWSAPLDAALPSRFWPRTSQTAAGAMNLLRPASSPLPRQRLLPFPAVQRRHDLLLRRAFHNCRYLVLSDDLLERFEMVLFRQHPWTFRSVWRLSEEPCSNCAFREGDSNYIFRDGDSGYVSRDRRRTHLPCVRTFRRRTPSGDVRIFRDVRISLRTRLGDARIFLTCVCISDGVRDLMYVYYDYDVRILTTCSCDVRIFRRRASSTDVRIIRYVRILLAYAFYRRTHIVTTYFGDRRTYFSVVRVLSTYAFTDVRHSAAYVLWKSRIRDYAVETRIRDYTLDLVKKIPLARSGLRLAPKIYDWHFDYISLWRC